MRTNYQLTTILLLIGICGCASVPRETAVLSAQLSRELAQAERAHLNLIDEYIAQRKARTEIFLHHVWVPLMIKTFMKNINFQKEVCKLRGEMDRALVVQEIVEAISKQIEKKRRELFKPIRKAKRDLTRRVRDHYAQAQRINRAVTLNIRSVVRGQNLERDIRSALSKPLNKIIPLEETSKRLDKLLELAEEIK